MIDRLVKAIHSEAASESANVGSGKKIADTSVVGHGTVASSISRDIGLEDAAGKSAYRQCDVVRQRAIEMCGKSELEAHRQVHIPAKRKLVRAVQGIRTDVFRWIVEVRSHG